MREADGHGFTLLHYIISPGVLPPTFILLDWAWLLHSREHGRQVMDLVTEDAHGIRNRMIAVVAYRIASISSLSPPNLGQRWHQERRKEVQSMERELFGHATTPSVHR